MSQAKWQTLQWAGRIAKYATLNRLSDSFGFGYVDPPPPDPQQGETLKPQRVRFIQWFGFRSRPVVTGGEGVVVAPRGGPTNAIAVAMDNLKVGPTDLQEGESVQYSSGGGTIKCDAQGGITLTGKGGGVVSLDPSQPTVSTSDTLLVDHIAGQGGIPVAVPGPGLGTMPPGTVLVTGHDAAMTVEMTVMDPAATPDLLCTITFGKTYGSAPNITGICPQSSNLASPPPSGVAGCMYALALPGAVQFTSTLPFTPGTYRFSFGVVG